MNKFAFSMWNYHPIDKMGLDEMDVWAELGMTVPMLPETVIGKDEPEKLLPWLDRAEKLGIKAIVNYTNMGYSTFESMGAERYEEFVKPVFDVLAGHPANHGFYIGDEPHRGKAVESSLGCIKSNKKLAPHLTPLLNYMGSTFDFPAEEFGGKDFKGWMAHVFKETGTREICFDDYSPQINDHGGKTDFFKGLKKWKEAAVLAGDSDLWGCLLSSGHHVYTPPKEVDYRWQIHVSAALGLRGVFWFRLYDKPEVNTYYGSPIDEFGDKTEAFYGMKRCQRRFLNHYGEIFMRLHFKEAFFVKSGRGVFPDYNEASHYAIKKIYTDDEALVSFFEDDNGGEYMCFVNCETKHYGYGRFYYDKSKYCLKEVVLNKAVSSDEEDNDFESHDDCEEFTIMPAGLYLYKIESK